MSEKENNAYVNFVSGGVGSALSKTALSPLQRVSTLHQLGRVPATEGYLQTFLNIARNEGPRGMWKGNLTSVLQRFPYSGSQLYFYDRIKYTIITTFGYADSAWWMKAVAGGAAATMSGMLCFPLEVIRTRLMSGDPKYRYISTTAKTMYKEEGPLAFYNGLGPTLVQRVPDIVINYVVYETVKFGMEDSGFGKIPAMLSGSTAAALTAVAVTYPLDTVRRRMMMNGKGGVEKYTSGLHCFASILRKEGVRGLYRGAEVECSRVVPQVCLMWFIIEGVRGLLQGPSSSAAAAAPSKAASSSSLPTPVTNATIVATQP